MDVKQDFIDGQFGGKNVGEILVEKLLSQMAKVKGFIALFGPYTPGSELQRWADYQRFDWSVRMLPAISVYESQEESKESDQAFQRGTITLQTVWPPNMRRSDSRRVEVAYKGALEGFFSSALVDAMLDELYYIERPEKVPGLNELGRTLTWTPNTEGLIGDELCPITVLNVQYKIDLRSWYRWLEYKGRSKDEPFDQALFDLVEIGGMNNNISAYTGVDDQGVEQVEIPEKIPVHNP